MLSILAKIASEVFSWVRNVVSIDLTSSRKALIAFIISERIVFTAGQK